MLQKHQGQKFGVKFETLTKLKKNLEISGFQVHRIAGMETFKYEWNAHGIKGDGVGQWLEYK